ncbi:MAG TPA: DUF2934 domain-containing protein [Opitutaceae bacterium]
MTRENTHPEAAADRVRREAAHGEIARRARELWEQEGRPVGRDEEIWLEAERQLRGINATESPLPADDSRR